MTTVINLPPLRRAATALMLSTALMGAGLASVEAETLRWVPARFMCRT